MIDNADATTAPDGRPGDARHWLTRFALRLVCCYWALYLWPSGGAVSLAHLVPRQGYQIGLLLGWPLDRLAEWVGAHFFHLQGIAATWHPPAVGDTALNYVRVACIAMLALAAAFLWSAIEERGPRPLGHRTVYAWVLMAVRYTLALTLFKYGFIKIFPGQFPVPDLRTLTETYGQSSPMHLLWTFVGASKPYEIFGGLLEAGAGSLLLFRRTCTLGALAAGAVFLNIAVLNFCYDVEAKLYSINLLLMCAFLLLPDLPPLLRFFVHQRLTVLTGGWPRAWQRRPLRIASGVLQCAIILDMLWSVGVGTYRAYRHPPPRPPLYGIWSIDPSSGLPQGASWSRIIIDLEQRVYVVNPDNEAELLITDPGAPAGTLRLDGRSGGGNLQWRKDNTGVVTLTGTWRGAAVNISMHKTGPESFALQQRKFRWVSEFPLNQ